MKAIAEPFFQIPQGVNHAVDRPQNIITRCWNAESESADAAKLQEQAFSVEELRSGRRSGGSRSGVFIPREGWSQGGRRRNINLAILINVIS